VILGRLVVPQAAQQRGEHDVLVGFGQSTLEWRARGAAFEQQRDRVLERVLGQAPAARHVLGLNAGLEQLHERELGPGEQPGDHHAANSAATERRVTAHAIDPVASSIASGMIGPSGPSPP
jgi:hypothetical protein